MFENDEEEGLEPIQFLSSSEDQTALPEPGIDAQQAAPSPPNVEYPDDQGQGFQGEFALRDKSTKKVRNSTPPGAPRS